MSFKPTISDYEGHKNFTQEITLKTDLYFTYTKGAFGFTPTVNFIGDRPLYWIDISYQAANNLILETGYNFNYKIFAFGAKYKKIHLKLYASNTETDELMAVGMVFSAKYEW
jgi:hypothetical protein